MADDADPDLNLLNNWEEHLGPHLPLLPPMKTITITLKSSPADLEISVLSLDIIVEWTQLIAAINMSIAQWATLPQNLNMIADGFSLQFRGAENNIITTIQMLHWSDVYALLYTVRVCPARARNRSR